MSPDRRLRRLEQMVPPTKDLLPAIAVLDGQNIVIDDGSPAIVRWIGKPGSCLPSGVQIVRGIDPRLVFGKQRGMTDGRQSKAKAA